MNQNQEEIALKSTDTSRILHMPNDEDIDKVMELIKKQFPDLPGLQNCLIGQSLQSFPKTEGAFIQILHVNENHWITVQHIPKLHIVKVYDSISESTSEDAKRQIAALLRTKDNQIELRIQKVQYQKQCTDSGIFAVAFATDLAHGCNPSKCKYKKDLLWSHFWQCLSKERMTPFPSTAIKNGAHKTEYINVHCTCRLPENELMVQCSECKERYHTSCIDITPPDTLHWKWKCSICTVTCNSERKVTMEGNQCKCFSHKFIWHI